MGKVMNRQFFTRLAHGCSPFITESELGAQLVKNRAPRVRATSTVTQSWGTRFLFSLQMARKSGSCVRAEACSRSQLD
jgi:hypothetical protein